VDAPAVEPRPDEPAPWGAEVAETQVLGYPCLTFVNRRKHLRELLIDGRRFAHRDYLVQGERRLTFADHEDAVAATSALLRERGVVPGDRVVLYGANAIEWVVAFWAVHLVGAIVVLGNAWWSETEVTHALETVTPALVIADDARAQLLGSGVACLTFSEIADQLGSGRSASSGDGAPAREDDPAIVLFTSGTTGLPKGAVLSHRGILSTLQSLMLLTRRLPAPDVPAPPTSKSLLSLPLFHVGGAQQIMTPMVAGGTLIFTEGRFDPARVGALIEREQISVWSTVPTMASRVMDYLEEVGHPGLTSVRTVGLGGSPVGAALRTRVPRWFPNAARGVAVTYGLSEAGGVLATGVGKDLSDRPGTVGRALKVVTLRIDQPDEEGCGEILARSPSVMLGYWPADGSSSDTDSGPITADRWLRTGDIGRLDDDGFLYVTDRSKDIVIRGGENIATPHVENRLLEHPAVLEVAVVGLPHAELGEELGAIVVVRPEDETTAEELRAFVAEQLAYFEVPTCWLLQHERLPQNATGKIVKREVRQRWIAQLDAVSAGRA
jgi:long-chain acyl-CoA synthetase